MNLVDKCIGSRIHIVMKNDKEIVGTLLGFDDFVSILADKLFNRACLASLYANDMLYNVFSMSTFNRID